MFVKATRDIDEFEEVTISYCDLTLNVHERQAETQQAWGFTCHC